ncbi:MAG: hypothetical protein JWM97_2834 [Phycisphaerales bacterium]|nr:hypothetical protein [Phycisphaerales bacterium]
MADNDLHATAFPRLDDTQIASLGQCAGAPLRKYSDADNLYKDMSAYLASRIEQTCMSTRRKFSSNEV